ncbi:PAS/PAC sensor signal transduction histidine kinase [Chitinophaga costaii]|uniref:histidine kinase n=1 Tax=Chitinophaga costaii TaxID=1335309 RepID=A0A1C4EG33_9BACT|nr:ATP-binding protein [Chitinophaga costaii]PUZ23845.1 PAS domain S-box protein [Chitinophaga costaii]SCC42569.1 PAS/PAC sensor signal transduction histidine kinase [Chitinophaga costaii]
MQQMDTKRMLAHKMVEGIEDYAVLLLDIEGNIESWNKGAEKVKGYKAEEIIGRNFRVFYTPEDLDSDRPSEILKIASEKGAARDEGWRLRKDGTRFWGSIVITAIQDENQEVIGFSKVTKDITAHKNVEEAQQRYLQQLESRHREIEQLTYIASHDLQQPLRTITHYLSMFELKYQPMVEEQGRMYIEGVMKAAARMRELIRNMLEYATLGVQKALSEVDTNLLLDEVKQDLYETITSAGAIVESGTLPLLRGYRVELRQLLQNLVSNAIKFSQPGIPPHIKVSAEYAADKWIFCVEDNGIGIAAHNIPSIFMMFQRLHSKEEYPGAGIGLAYAKKIVLLHNGQIWVQSELDKGSRFYFSIPNTL